MHPLCHAPGCTKPAVFEDATGEYCRPHWIERQPVEGMTEARLAELDALYTPGEWSWQNMIVTGYWLRSTADPNLRIEAARFEEFDRPAERAFIAAVHNAYPALSSALRAAWAERDRLRAENEQLRAAMRAGLPFVAQWSLTWKKNHGAFNDHILAVFYQQRRLLGLPTYEEPPP